MNPSTLLRPWLLSALLAFLAFLNVARAQPGPLLLVPEHAGQRLTLIDAQRWQPLAQLDSPHPLQGAPQISPDGRYAYWAAAGGWVVQWDLWQRCAIAQAHSGQTLQDLRLSRDGRWLLVGYAQPHSLTLFDASLRPQRSYAARTLDASASAPVASLHLAPARQRFVVVLQGLAELWEISTDPAAEDIFDGLVHDYKMGEAIAKPGYLGVRRTPLPAALGDVYLAPGERIVIGAAQPLPGRAFAANLLVMHLDARSQIAALRLPGEPQPSAGALWLGQQGPGQSIFILPSRDGQHTALLDTRRWQPLPPGPASALPTPLYQLRSHPSQASLWAQTAADRWQVLNAQTLQPQAAIDGQGQPLHGPVWSHDASLALFHTPGPAGALHAYDAATGALRARLPLHDALGVYPVPELR